VGEDGNLEEVVGQVEGVRNEPLLDGESPPLPGLGGVQVPLERLPLQVLRPVQIAPTCQHADVDEGLRHYQRTGRKALPEGEGRFEETTGLVELAPVDCDGS